MIQINLIYPNGIKYTAQTLSVQDLIEALQKVPNPTTTAVLYHDHPKQGLLPMKADGIFLDPDVSARFFRISLVVDVD
jgi:hypothetical protein